MKKNSIICMIVSAALLSGLMTGCSGSGPQEITRSAAVKTTEAVTVKTTEVKTEDTGVSSDATAAAETAKVPESTSPEATAETQAKTDASETETSAAPGEERDLTAVQPKIYITSEGPVESREEYVKCTVTVEDTYEEYLMNEVSAKIRVRGNSTAENTETPPYKIKFDVKTAFLGLHNGEDFKTWVLLNMADGICANLLALKMGKLVYGENYYVSDATLVKVYLNGTYMGLYTACEQTQIKKNRIHVTEAVTGEESGDSIGYLFEMDNYAETGVDNTFYIDAEDLSIRDFEGREKKAKTYEYTLKNDLLSTEQVDFIAKYMNNLYQLIYAATYKNTAYEFDADYNLKESSLSLEEAIRQVIDVDSAVAVYLLEEITANQDKGNGSFFFAIDFSPEGKYQKLTFTPPWDLGWRNKNITSGFYAGTINENKTGVESDNEWLIMLMCHEWFRDEVANRVQELEETGNVEKLLDETSVYMHTFEEDMEEAYIYDADEVIEFFRTRYQWLVSEFGQ